MSLMENERPKGKPKRELSFWKQALEWREERYMENERQRWKTNEIWAV